MRKKMQLTRREMEKFESYLRHNEREPATIEAYLRSLRKFAEWADSRTITKELAAAWKAELLESGYCPVSVNAMLAAVNKFFACMGREDCKVKYLKLQRRMFRKPERELTKAEYLRLVQAAHEKGDLRLELLLETICATGIRVSEVKYITVEAVRSGQLLIKSGKKTEIIRFPASLQEDLLRFAAGNGRTAGMIFTKKNGTPIERTQVSLYIQKLAQAAQVPAEKGNIRALRQLYKTTIFGIEANFDLLVRQAYERQLETEQLSVGWE